MIDRKSATFARSQWCDALQELTLCCAGDDPCDTPDRLRELNALMLDASATALFDGLKPLAPAHLDDLIHRAAYESAAMAMMGAGTGYLVSRNGDGHSMATVALPGSFPEKSGSGMTPALALIGAMALAMSSVAGSARASARQTLVNVRPALH